MSKLVSRGYPAGETSRHLRQELEIWFRFSNTGYTGPVSIGGGAARCKKWRFKRFCHIEFAPSLALPSLATLPRLARPSVKYLNILELINLPRCREIYRRMEIYSLSALFWYQAANKFEIADNQPEVFEIVCLGRRFWMGFLFRLWRQPRWWRWCCCCRRWWWCRGRLSSGLLCARVITSRRKCGAAPVHSNQLHDTTQLKSTELFSFKKAAGTVRAVWSKLHSNHLNFNNAGFISVTAPYSCWP